MEKVTKMHADLFYSNSLFWYRIRIFLKAISIKYKLLKFHFFVKFKFTTKVL